MHTGQYEALHVPASGKTTEAPPVPVCPPLELEPPVVNVAPPLELEPPVEVPPLELADPPPPDVTPPLELEPPVEVLVPPLELEPPPVEVLAPPAPALELAPPLELEFEPPAPASSVIELLELVNSPPPHDSATRANQCACFMDSPCSWLSVPGRELAALAGSALRRAVIDRADKPARGAAQR